MKKGDIRKQEYLQAAEFLFCRKGYEATAVQDILDRLNASKGSFYHHFVSKEALLEQICRRRAELIFSYASAAAEGTNDAVVKLNTLLSGMIPFRDEKLSFLLMLLPVFRLPEGRMVRECYCESLAEQFRDAVIRCLVSGGEQGILVCPAPGHDAGILLTIVNHLWTKICDMILDAGETGTETDISECLSLADRCRSAAERMLSLPYGSLDLINLPMLKLLCEQIRAHRMR